MRFVGEPDKLWSHQDALGEASKYIKNISEIFKPKLVNGINKKFDVTTKCHSNYQRSKCRYIIDSIFILKCHKMSIVALILIASFYIPCLAQSNYHKQSQFEQHSQLISRSPIFAKMNQFWPNQNNNTSSATDPRFHQISLNRHTLEPIKINEQAVNYQNLRLKQTNGQQIMHQPLMTSSIESRQAALPIFDLLQTTTSSMVQPIITTTTTTPILFTPNSNADKQLTSINNNKLRVNISNTCEPNNKMLISVSFSKPFNGLIHTKDSRKKPACAIEGNGDSIYFLNIRYTPNLQDASNCGLISNSADNSAPSSSVTNNQQYQNTTLSVVLVVRLHKTIEFSNDKFFLLTCTTNSQLPTSIHDDNQLPQQQHPASLVTSRHNRQYKIPELDKLSFVNLASVSQSNPYDQSKAANHISASPFREYQTVNHLSPRQTLASSSSLRLLPTPATNITSGNHLDDKNSDQLTHCQADIELSRKLKWMLYASILLLTLLAVALLVSVYLCLFVSNSRWQRLRREKSAKQCFSTQQKDLQDKQNHHNHHNHQQRHHSQYQLQEKNFTLTDSNANVLLIPTNRSHIETINNGHQTIANVENKINKQSNEDCANKFLNEHSSIEFEHMRVVNNNDGMSKPICSSNNWQSAITKSTNQYNHTNFNSKAFGKSQSIRIPKHLNCSNNLLSNCHNLNLSSIHRKKCKSQTTIYDKNKECALETPSSSSSSPSSLSVTSASLDTKSHSTNNQNLPSKLRQYSQVPYNYLNMPMLISENNKLNHDNNNIPTIQTDDDSTTNSPENKNEYCHQGSAFSTMQNRATIESTFNNNHLMFGCQNSNHIPKNITCNNNTIGRHHRQMIENSTSQFDPSRSRHLAALLQDKHNFGLY